MIRRLVRFREQPAASAGYEILAGPPVADSSGWRAESVAERQHQAFEPLIQAARSGSPRRDFAVAAEAIRRTGLMNPSILDVGCGSGYYAELLPILLGAALRYVGVDYASSMIRLARRTYPREHFVTADARRLPFPPATFDVVMSGTSLMHIPDYETAIRESVRVSLSWCVFHTVPVMEGRPTTYLRKRAFGETVAEVVFNRTELERIFEREGLRIDEVFESIPYDLSEVLGESTKTLTYLCRDR